MLAKGPTQLISESESDKEDKLNPNKIFWYSALLIPFCLIGCGDKAPQPNDTKSIKIEITAPNEAKIEPKSKDKSKELNAISGIKIEDPIDRIDLILGVNASDPINWDDLSSEYKAVRDFKRVYFSLGVGGEKGRKSITEFIAIKSKTGKISAFSCVLLFFDHSDHQEANGDLGEVYFYSINPSPCQSGKIRLYKPIFGEAFGEVSGVKESNIQQLLGDPEQTRKIGEADALLLGRGKMESFLNHHTKSIRKIKYGNSYIYVLRDRVIGMAIFDNDIKELYEKIEAGLIK